MADARARSASKSMEDSLRALTEEFVRKVAETIQSQFAREFQDRFQSFLTGSIKDISVAKPYRLCPVPGCGKPGAGPRYGWFCREHATELSESEKSQFRKNRGATAAAKTTRGKKRAPKNNKSVDTDQVKRLKAEGMSLSQIAGKLGISKTSVVRHLKK